MQLCCGKGGGGSCSCRGWCRSGKESWQGKGASGALRSWNWSVWGIEMFRDKREKPGWLQVPTLTKSGSSPFLEGSGNHFFSFLKHKYRGKLLGKRFFQPAITKTRVKCRQLGKCPFFPVTDVKMFWIGREGCKGFMMFLKCCSGILKIFRPFPTTFL